MNRLFSYKLTRDCGFAPNPFWGYLTLATCKPKIRAHKKLGDWIAGFTSKQLGYSGIDHAKLIYLMNVTEILPLAEYYRDQRFKNKIPAGPTQAAVHRAGDNIYRPLSEWAHESDDFERLENRNHDEKDKKKDISGKNVLISNHFFYFGKNALEIPDNVSPRVPKYQSSHGVRTYDQARIAAFIDYVAQHGQGIHGAPHLWSRKDHSWKTA